MTETILNRYVWVYLSHDQKRNIWEWSSWQSKDDNGGLGIPTPHLKVYSRNGVRYTVRSEYPLKPEDALQIVRSLYEYEFSTAHIR